MVRRAATIGAAVLMALVLLPTAPAAAHSCYGWGCDGKDPAAYGCDAVTFYQIYWADATYQFRYSQESGTVWTRIISPKDTYDDYGLINTYNCIAADNTCRVGYFAKRTLKGTSWTVMMNVVDTRRHFRTCLSHNGDVVADYCGPRRTFD